MFAVALLVFCASENLFQGLKLFTHPDYLERNCQLFPPCRERLPREGDWFNRSSKSNSEFSEVQGWKSNDKGNLQLRSLNKQKQKKNQTCNPGKLNDCPWSQSWSTWASPDAVPASFRTRRKHGQRRWGRFVELGHETPSEPAVFIQTSAKTISHLHSFVLESFKEWGMSSVED